MWSARRLAPARRAIVAILAVAAVLGGSASDAVGSGVVGAGGVQGSDIVVAGFSVSDDMSSATVDLLNADGVSASGPDGPLRVGSGGALRIPLPSARVTQPATVTVNLTDVPAGMLQVSYYPAAYYQSIGSDLKGYVILFSTLPRADNTARHEPDSLPPADFLDVNQQAWTDARSTGVIPPTTDPMDEQIRRLFGQFDGLNDPSLGNLCPDSGAGIDTFGAMADHTCFVWCTGYSRILRDALRSAGTPARYVGLAAVATVLSNGVKVQSSEEHATVEMWANGHWRWVDSTFRVLRAVGADGQELTANGVIEALANPTTRDTVRFTRLDPTTGQWRTLAYPAEDPQFKDALARYWSADKTFFIPNGGRG